MMKVQLQTRNLVVFESALYRTTSSLLLHPDALVLVDPNWLPAEIDFIRQWVDRVRAGRPLYLLFTHSDYDHIIGWKAFVDAKVIASAAFHEKKDKAKDLQEIRAFDSEYYIRSHYPIAYPEVDFVIREEGQLLELEGLRLRFYGAPGHTAEGLFAIAEQEGVWIAGDYLSNVEFPFVNDSLAAYRRTMDRAAQIAERSDIGHMVPGHGDVAHERVEMQRRIGASREYLDGLEAVAKQAGAFDFERLLAGYPFPEGLRKAHEENIRTVRKELGLETNIA